MKKGEKKLHVAFIVWFFPCLSETFVLNQILQFQKLGHKVSIYAFKDPSKSLAAEDNVPETTVHKAVFDNDLLKRLSYGSPRRIWKILSSNTDIDIVYFQFGDVAAEVMQYGVLPMPTVATFHNSVRLNKSSVHEQQQRFAHVFSQATVVLAITEYTADCLRRLNCPREKIKIHHMGIDASVFRSATRRGGVKRKKSFVFVLIGRFVEKKGITIAVRAFYILQHRYGIKDVELIVIGDGIMRERIKSLIKRLNIVSQVQLLGKLEQRRVVNILRRADCLLCPSMPARDGDEEGLPVVLMEAAALSVPAIATQHAAIPEFTSRFGGLLVPARNSLALARAMLQVIRNYSHHQRIAVKARHTVLRDYNVTIQVKKLVDLFIRLNASPLKPGVVKTFLRRIGDTALSEIDSITVVGSAGACEVLSPLSDIDIVILCKSKTTLSPFLLSKIRRGVMYLNQVSGLRVTPQVFSRFDFDQLVSPVFMRSYRRHGWTIWGRNITDIIQWRIHPVSLFEYDIFLLRRILFDRYSARQYFLHGYSGNTLRELTKKVLATAMNVLELDGHDIPLRRRELAQRFFEVYNNAIPLDACDVLLRSRGSKEQRFRRSAVEFIENYAQRAVKKMRLKHPKRHWRLPVF